MLRRLLIVAGLVVLCPSAQTQAAIILSVEGPGVSTSSVVGAIMETFAGYSVGSFTGVNSSAIGTYNSTAGVTIDAVNQHGGIVVPVGTDNFLRTGTGSATITFNSAVGYFGFWLSAGDSGNQVQLTTTSGGTFTFTLDTIVNSGLLTPGLITAATPGHFGNPFAPFQTQNPSQPYVYVNLFATDTNSRFTQATFSGGNFESDNHTILTSLTDVLGTIVQTQGVTTTVPEPATMTQLAFGAVSLLGFGWRRKRLR
ncbi:MAG: PEP-CTERM sorting domain-containing protein [Gemmataceae bacterium]